MDRAPGYRIRRRGDVELRSNEPWDGVPLPGIGGEQNVSYPGERSRNYTHDENSVQGLFCLYVCEKNTFTEAPSKVSRKRLLHYEKDPEKELLWVSSLQWKLPPSSSLDLALGTEGIVTRVCVSQANSFPL